MNEISDLTAVEAVLHRRSRLVDLDTGRDITRQVRKAFGHALPACGGDRAAAATRAFNAALAEAKQQEGAR